MDLLDLGGLALPPVNADLPPTPSQHPASAPSGDTSLLDLDVLGSADSSFSAAAAPSLAVDLMSPGVDSFAAGESESSTIASDLLSPSPVPGANGSLLVDLGGGEPTEGPVTGEQVEGGSSFEGSLAGLSLSLVDPATSPSPVPSPPSSLVSSPEPLVTRVRGSSHDHPSKHSHRHEPPASYRAAVALQKWEALYDELDRNGDGEVNPREIVMAIRGRQGLAAELGLPTDLSEGGGRDRLMELFHSMDKNEDGGVSKEEFGQWRVKRIYTFSTTYKYLPSEAEKRRAELLEKEVEELKGMRDSDAEVVMPWLPAGAAAAAPPPAFESAKHLLSSFYDLDNAKHRGAAEDASVLEGLHAKAGGPLDRMKFILGAWRSKRVQRAFMQWFKFAFVRASGGAVAEEEQQRSHAESWGAVESGEKYAGAVREAEEAKADLKNCFALIEELQHKNHDLSHQVKQLLLQTFSLKTAAITVGGGRVKAGGGRSPRRAAAKD
ncbi:hypothetical protein TeGR_g7831 [Tetraparma gracilis]|uniref:EF-hand domain-containing protein n=1 Tax=Tetraparma gracilis TaxID=2962635 RepID=A0ABQ6MYL7_9STRA|nr:hypothetical protein TeGR_g7831 [Tetraparma gracilis]